jgi:hypothetical protein
MVLAGFCSLIAPDDWLLILMFFQKALAHPLDLW